MRDSRIWMVRAAGGEHIAIFESGVVGIYFGIDADLSGRSLGYILNAYTAAHPDASPIKARGAAGMLDRIVNTMQIGDLVVSCDPGTRTYLLGEITSNYLYAGPNEPVPHRRRVTWQTARAHRDNLKEATRNQLGSTLTIFQPTDEVWAELQLVAQGKAPETAPDAGEVEAVIQQDKAGMVEQARERVKDRIVALDDRQMEELLAALLRALGFRTQVSPVGPDRGVDVIASPDGLGLQEPRIKAEVKHRRNTAIGAPEVRGFIGALRTGDRGIYLSTGGFTREARYEADRANVPLTLMDLDDLARLIETHYANFDTEGRALLPLTAIYWPVE